MASRGARQFYLRTQNRMKVYQNRLYSNFHSAIKSIFDDVLSTLTIPSKEEMVSRLQSRTRAGFIMIATAGFRYGLVDAEERYGKKLPVPVEKDLTMDELKLFGLAAVIRAIEFESMRKVVTIIDKLHNKLREIFKDSVQAMEGRPELSQRIKEVAESYPGWMANRIAQTETTRAFNHATLEGYKKSTVVSGKEWVSNIMGNPRHPPESEFDHLGANGEVVDVDKPFVLTGEDLMYPGDDAGSAGNTISCHCSLMPVITI